MNTYKTNVTGWSPSEEFLKVLRELGFKSGSPSIPRGSDTGSFWLFGEDVDKMKEMMTKKLTVCIESANRKYFVSGTKNDKALYCEFTVVSK